MGEKETRAAIDRMAKRIREGDNKAGGRLSQEQARKQAVTIAKRHDRKNGG